MLAQGSASSEEPGVFGMAPLYSPVGVSPLSYPGVGLENVIQHQRLAAGTQAPDHPHILPPGL